MNKWSKFRIIVNVLLLGICAYFVITAGKPEIRPIDIVIGVILVIVAFILMFYTRRLERIMARSQKKTSSEKKKPTEKKPAKIS